MKRFQYSINYRGTIEVYADNADEAQDVAQAELPPDAEIIDWEQCDNDPSGGDKDE